MHQASHKSLAIANMSPGDQSFNFLSLPLELRRKVYDELLQPNPEQRSLLWHDRPGKIRRSSFYPVILRVNKQINAEAVSILYESNYFIISAASSVVKQCTGGTYPDRLGSPRDLFRTAHQEAEQEAQTGAQADAEDQAQIKLQVETQSNAEERIDGKKRGRTDQKPRGPSIRFRESFDPGLIYPHCFQRLQNIELVTSVDAIWGSARGGRFLSHICSLILEILQVLASEDIPSPRENRRKTFKFTIKRKLVSGFSQDKLFRSRRIQEDQLLPLNEMFLVLKDVATKRQFSVFEEIITRGGDDNSISRKTIREIPIERLADL